MADAAAGASSIFVDRGAGGDGLPPPTAPPAALVSHAKSLAVALAPQRIQVNTVAPGSMSFTAALGPAEQETPISTARS